MVYGNVYEYKTIIVHNQLHPMMATVRKHRNILLCRRTVMTQTDKTLVYTTLVAVWIIVLASYL